MVTADPVVTSCVRVHVVSKASALLQGCSLYCLKSKIKLLNWKHSVHGSLSLLLLQGHTHINKRSFEISEHAVNRAVIKPEFMDQFMFQKPEMSFYL